MANQAQTQTTAELLSEIDDVMGRKPDAAADADGRRESALTERMAVRPRIDSHDRVEGYEVLSESGSIYTVTMGGPRGGREDCDCMDMTMNNPRDGCKHVQRVGLSMSDPDTPLPPEDERVAPFAEAVADLSDVVATLKDRVVGLDSNTELEGVDLTAGEVADYVGRVSRAIDTLQADDESDADADDEEVER